ncbi:hypothetical protein GQ42DRAFT_169756 [Ramicandelaber brevisporus]|nr:hypothetical protein GQ42DRAFT_169756 [Ramicandelaber brevisporus]
MNSVLSSFKNLALNSHNRSSAAATTVVFKGRLPLPKCMVAATPLGRTLATPTSPLLKKRCLGSTTVDAAVLGATHSHTPHEVTAKPSNKRSRDDEDGSGIHAVASKRCRSESSFTASALPYSTIESPAAQLQHINKHSMRTHGVATSLYPKADAAAAVADKPLVQLPSFHDLVFNLNMFGINSMLAAIEL